MGRPTPLEALGAVAAILGLAFAAMLLVLPRVTSTTPLVVLTGSMSPTIPVGSMVYVETVPPEEIAVDDIITYQRGESASVTSHRVIDIERDDEGDPRFITQGDANNAADLDPVTADRYRGRVAFSIPFIGYVRDFVASTTGLALLAIAGAAVWLLDRRRDDETTPQPPPIPAVAAAAATQDPPDQASPEEGASASPLRPARTHLTGGSRLAVESQQLLVARITIASLRRSQLLDALDLARGQVLAISPEQVACAISGTREELDDVEAFLRDSYHVDRIVRSEVVEIDGPSIDVHLGADHAADEQTGGELAHHEANPPEEAVEVPVPEPWPGTITIDDAQFDTATPAQLRASAALLLERDLPLLVSPIKLDARVHERIGGSS